MVSPLAAVAAALVAVPLVAVAACPEVATDCLSGGGNPATDCYVAFAGIPSTTTSCTDGDPSCDQDGRADGVCTFPLEICVNVPQPGCTPAALGAPRVTPRKGAGTTLGAALGAVLAADPSAAACTAPGFAVTLKTAVAGLKPAVAKVKASVAAGRKRDTDTATLTCMPGAPHFEADVQPLFTQKCAFSGCHSSASHQQGLVLDEGVAYGALVNKQMTEAGPLLLVAPGSVKGSYLTRKILGKHLAPGTAIMPQGCPGAPQNPGGCLTPGDIATILEWIQAGAPND